MKNRMIEAILITLSVVSIIVHLLNLRKYPRIDIDPWGIYVVLAVILLSVLNIVLRVRIVAISILAFSGVMFSLVLQSPPYIFSHLVNLSLSVSGSVIRAIPARRLSTDGTPMS